MPHPNPVAHDDDPDLLEAEGHELLARAARLRATRRTEHAPSSTPPLLSKKMYVARFGCADGWEAAVRALPNHRLGRGVALDAAELEAWMRSRPPRKARPKIAKPPSDSAADGYAALTTRAS